MPNQPPAVDRLWRNATTRRQALYGASVFALGLAASACGSSDEATSSSTSSGSGSSGAAKSGGRVVITSSGGNYEEAWRKAAWEPFTKETGIEVVPVVAKTDKLLASLKAGNVEVDVLDQSEFQFATLIGGGAIVPFEWDRLQLTKRDDLLLQKDDYAGNIAYAQILAYNTDSYPSPPQNWVDAWDTKKFPGKRTFADVSAGSTQLAQAYLSTGVSVENVYPIDLDKAFDAFKAIKPSVSKFYTAAAQSTQIFESGTATIGGTYNGRVQELATAGKPVAIQWNQAELLNQGFGVTKGAPNAENAWKLIDYSLQPKVLAEFATLIGYGPLSTDAYQYISDDVSKILPTSPDKVENSFNQDAQWWSDNLPEVQSRWQKLLLS